MNKQEIIDQAMQLAAGIGNDPLASPVIDGDMTAEDILPHAFRHAYRNLIETGGISLQDVIRAHTIECVEVDTPFERLEGPLPAGVLVEYLDSSFLPGYPYSSFQRYLADFNRQKFTNLLCYFTVNDGTFFTTCGVPDDGSGSTEESEESSEEAIGIILHAASIPVIPVNPATDIAMPERARDVVVMTLAQALRGEIKFSM